MALVFVVDDDPGVLRVTAMSLQVEGFEVATFPSGLHALTALSEERHPDAIVLDLNMPDMDGRQVFRAARQAGCESPVLILSAYSPDTARDELGADAWLTKPFAPTELARKVRELSQHEAPLKSATFS